MVLIQNLDTVFIAPQGSTLFIFSCLYYYSPYTQGVLKSDTGWINKNVIGLKVLFHNSHSSVNRLYFSVGNWLMKATIIFICLVCLIKKHLAI